MIQNNTIYPFISKIKNGFIEWKLSDKRYRRNYTKSISDPDLIWSMNPGDTIYYIVKNDNKLVHRKFGPAVIRKHKYKAKHWIQHDDTHRIDGFSTLEYEFNHKFVYRLKGSLSTEEEYWNL